MLLMILDQMQSTQIEVPSLNKILCYCKCHLLSKTNEKKVVTNQAVFFSTSKFGYKTLSDSKHLVITNMFLVPNDHLLYESARL